MKLIISYTPSFVRHFNTLENDLQEEVLEKIELSKHPNNHKMLKVRKLTGPLKNRYSFSVNYRIRIVFIYLNKEDALLLAIGTHDIYR